MTEKFKFIADHPLDAEMKTFISIPSAKDDFIMESQVISGTKLDILADFIVEDDVETYKVFTIHFHTIDMNRIAEFDIDIEYMLDELDISLDDEYCLIDLANNNIGFDWAGETRLGISDITQLFAIDRAEFTGIGKEMSVEEKNYIFQRAMQTIMSHLGINNECLVVSKKETIGDDIELNNNGFCKVSIVDEGEQQKLSDISVTSQHCISLGQDLAIKTVRLHTKDKEITSVDCRIREDLQAKQQSALASFFKR